MATEQLSSRQEKDWFIVLRWAEFEGEGRTNLLRLICVAAFYAIETIDYHGLDLGFVQLPIVSDRLFHLAVTLLTVAWGMLCLGVLLCRRNRIFPFWLKYLSTGCDLVLLTSVLTLGHGPKSPLVIAYFLIIAMASLRFSLRLIWFATGGALAGYLFLLGFARWGHLEGWDKPDQTVPRFHQIIFLLALVLSGVILGQTIRCVRGQAEHYARRQQAGGEGGE